jgi:hypothetical protein
MSLVRRRIAWVIGAWLLCQIANVSAAPLTFSCQNVASAADEEECCPGLLPGQVCPMHHAKKGEPTCQMRSSCAGCDTAIISLAIGAGAPPSSTPAVSTFDLGERIVLAPQSSTLRSDRPESPPPRA